MRSVKRTPTTLLALGLAGMLVLAGCSSDDSSNGGSASPAPEPATAGDEAITAEGTPAGDEVAGDEVAGDEVTGAASDSTEAAPAATSASAKPATSAKSSAKAKPERSSSGAGEPKATSAPKPSKASGGPAPAQPGSPAPDKGAAPAPAPAPKAGGGGNGGATDVGVSATEIKMGGIYMYGMPLAKLFIPPIYRAVDAPIQVANDQGGIHGRKITHLDCDDGTPDPARTRACYKKLVEQDKIFSFVGGATFVQGEIMPQVEKDQIPWVAPVSLYKSEWENPWVFPIHMAMEHEGVAGAEWVVDNLGPINRFGLLCLNTPEMQATCKAAQNTLEAAGAELVHQTNMDVTTPDLSGEILAMRAANPDHVLHYTVHPAATARFMIDAAQQDYWPPKGVSGNHMAFEALGGLVGDFPAKKGYWTNTTYKVWGADFIAYMRKFAPDNEGLNHHVLQGQWFGTIAGIEAMKALGPNLTRAGLRDVLYSRMWDAGPGIGNKFLWEPSQRKDVQTGNRTQYMYQYVNPDTRAKGDEATAPGLIPAPEQFVIVADDLSHVDN